MAQGLTALAASLPRYARDLAAGLTRLADIDALSPQQRQGAILAAAHAAAAPDLLQALGEAELSPKAADNARAAAALMAQNSVYFRSLGQLPGRGYETQRARLRMNVVLKPESPALDVHLWCVTAAAIFGCPDCLDEHEREARKAGATAEAVVAVLRIAAVVHGVSRVLLAEDARSRSRWSG